MFSFCYVYYNNDMFASDNNLLLSSPGSTLKVYIQYTSVRQGLASSKHCLILNVVLLFFVVA